MRTLRGCLIPILLLGAAGTAVAQLPPPRETGIKWFRDSAEYAALTRMVYRLATRQALESSKGLAPGSWAVILDLDETVLDNSPYQLERAAYGLPYDAASFVAWARREEAAAVPGAQEFIAAVRNAGGRVAWISNRDPAAADATRRNMSRLGLWNENDRLCLLDPKRPKAIRRAEVVTGEGECSWAGHRPSVLVLVGDQMGDFPQPGEKVAGSGSDSDFGATYFIVPNPMYGDWQGRVTRQ
jgi:5'-nucleotidase (lipoprotein e(P4) family)